MESKTLTLIVVVIACVFMFPVLIGVVGGVFGILGGVLGGIFGVLGSVIGGVAGFVGSIFGALFGFIGWLIGLPFHWNWPGPHVNLWSVLMIVIVIAMIVRSQHQKQAKR